MGVWKEATKCGWVLADWVWISHWLLLNSALLKLVMINENFESYWTWSMLWLGASTMPKHCLLLSTPQNLQLTGIHEEQPWKNIVYWKKSFLSTESDTKILQSIYFAYEVGIISSYSNRIYIKWKNILCYNIKWKNILCCNIKWKNIWCYFNAKLSNMT